MNRLRVSVLVAIATAMLALVGSATASAAITFEVDVNFDGSPAYTEVEGLDPSMRATMRAMRGAVVLDRSDPVNTDDAEIYAALQPGDVVEIYQYPAADPQLPAIPLIPPTRSVTVPNITAAVSAGSPVVSGLAGDELTVYVTTSNECRQRSVTVQPARSPGAYSATLPFAMTGQNYYRIHARNASTDEFQFRGRLAGDSGCISVDMSKAGDNSLKPYQIGTSRLDWTASPTARIRLVRAGVEIASYDGTELSLTEAQRPLAGDVVEVFRPKEAATPAYSLVIPSVVGTFDPGNDLTAVDSPGGELLMVYACKPVGCDESYDAIRGATSFPAGRTLVDFSTALGLSRPVDILPGDFVIGQFLSSDGLGQVTFDLTPGDLTSPIGKVKLASKLKAKGISKKLKFKLTSNEAGSLTAKLTIPAKKKGKKPATLASGKANVKVGKNSISLKTTSTGKKALKKIAKGKKSVSATLTLTLKDAAGNATTIVKGTKLK